MTPDVPPEVRLQLEALRASQARLRKPTAEDRERMAEFGRRFQEARERSEHLTEKASRLNAEFIATTKEAEAHKAVLDKLHLEALRFACELDFTV